jgi:hypothetical protein
MESTHHRTALVRQLAGVFCAMCKRHFISKTPLYDSFWLYNTLYPGVIQHCISLLIEPLYIYRKSGVIQRCIFNCYAFYGESSEH